MIFRVWAWQCAGFLSRPVTWIRKGNAPSEPFVRGTKYISCTHQQLSITPLISCFLTLDVVLDVVTSLQSDAGTMVLLDTLDLGQRSTYKGWSHAYTLFRTNPVNALADRIHPCGLSCVKCDKSYERYV